jgi:hypothetical protein
VHRCYDADYWRKRAEESRAIAAIMTTTSARREMEKIAIAYDRRAERAACMDRRDRASRPRAQY